MIQSVQWLCFFGSRAYKDICITIRGKGAMQKRVAALREVRRLLSRSEFPPIEAAIKAGAIPLLVQCLSFGSPEEQVQIHLLVELIFSFKGAKFSFFPNMSSDDIEVHQKFLFFGAWRSFCQLTYAHFLLPYIQ